jgi:hypothetical protein
LRTSRRTVIGWREWVALPDLGISRIKVKVDTGARSSSLHAFDARVVRRRGRDRLRFSIHPRQRESRTVVEAEADIIDRRTVRSSSGHQSIRYVIETKVEIAGETWPIELTLTNRDEMGFRMLLGRQAVRRRFVIDPGLSYLTGRVPPRTKLQPRPSRKRKAKGKTE